MRHAIVLVVAALIVVFTACSSPYSPCGPDPCAACPTACGQVDTCERDGTWSCTCACVDAGPVVDAGGGTKSGG